MYKDELWKSERLFDDEPLRHSRVTTAASADCFLLPRRVSLSSRPPRGPSSAEAMHVDREQHLAMAALRMERGLSGSPSRLAMEQARMCAPGQALPQEIAMQLGAFFDQSRRLQPRLVGDLLLQARLRAHRGRPRRQLPDPAQRHDDDRSVRRDVREEHADLQPRLDRGLRGPGFLHGRPRAAGGPGGARRRDDRARGPPTAPAPRPSSSRIPTATRSSSTSTSDSDGRGGESAPCAARASKVIRLMARQLDNSDSMGMLSP